MERGDRFETGIRGLTIELRDELLQLAVTIEPTCSVVRSMFTSNRAEDVVAESKSFRDGDCLRNGFDDPPVASLGSAPTLPELGGDGGRPVHWMPDPKPGLMIALDPT